MRTNWIQCVMGGVVALSALIVAGCRSHGCCGSAGCSACSAPQYGGSTYASPYQDSASGPTYVQPSYGGGPGGATPYAPAPSYSAPAPQGSGTR